MDILVYSTDNTKTFNFNICFDPYGNIYFDGTNYINDPYFIDVNNLIFQLDVDRDNNPCFDNCNYEITDGETKINKLKFENANENNVENNDENEEEYTIELDSNDNEILCDENAPFTFYCKNDDVQINHRENGDISALYDTEIYDNNNIMLVQALSGDNGSIYTLHINLTDALYFKSISDTDYRNKYKLSINESGELKFITN